MILAEFSKYLQLHSNDIMIRKSTPLELLNSWIYGIMIKYPKNNVEKIIHKEILFCKNDNGDCLIVGKSDSGRKLVNALINYAKSYDNYNHAKWVDMVEKIFHN